MFNRNGQVKPFAWLRPTNVELSLGRLHQIEWIVVNLYLSVKLRVGDVNTFIYPKFVEIRPVRFVEGPAATVNRIRIMIGDAFSA